MKAHLTGEFRLTEQGEEMIAELFQLLFHHQMKYIRTLKD